ncbi:hypothetical protein ATCC90586_012149 [Pythium insidiosum]|nr:hypothetical protein ATCC90586_012149 [Pythium insidiosum]
MKNPTPTTKSSASTSPRSCHLGPSRFDHDADHEYDDDDDASQAAESDDGESGTALDYDYVVFGGHLDDDSDDEVDVGDGDRDDHGNGHDDDSVADEAIEGTFEFDSSSSGCVYRDTCSAFVSTTTGCIYLDVTDECDWTQPRSSEVEMQPYFLV